MYGLNIFRIIQCMKKNWIDFESEISRVIQSIDKDIRKYKADDDTVRVNHFG